MLASSEFGAFGLPILGRSHSDPRRMIEKPEMPMRSAVVAPSDEVRYAALAARVASEPASFPHVRALARGEGTSPAAVAALLIRHGHLEPPAWLRRRRCRAAAGLLIDTRLSIPDIAAATGFADEAAFREQFLAETRMPPEDYRRLGASNAFRLRLPGRYRVQDVLAYHGRDPASPSERVQERRLLKAITFGDRPAVLEIELAGRNAQCHVHGRSRPSPARMREAHAIAVRLLGLTANVRAFEARARRDPMLAPLVARRPGLHLPLTASVFDALCWAIIGQQINLAFACALRREILALAGSPIGDLIAHPTPARLAALDAATLRRRRFSRSKAEYLLDTAAAVAAGRFDPERLSERSAVEVEATFTSLRGIGTWTARYVMMRGVGFADAAPVGDVALAAALARCIGRSERPAADEVERLMQPFSPYRSLATFHLWASLRDET